jgi:hypothetical protein
VWRGGFATFIMASSKTADTEAATICWQGSASIRILTSRSVQMALGTGQGLDPIWKILCKNIF